MADFDIPSLKKIFKNEGEFLEKVLALANGEISKDSEEAKSILTELDARKARQLAAENEALQENLRNRTV